MRAPIRLGVGLGCSERDPVESRFRLHYQSIRQMPVQKKVATPTIRGSRELFKLSSRLLKETYKGLNDSGVTQWHHFGLCLCWLYYLVHRRRVQSKLCQWWMWAEELPAGVDVEAVSE